VAVTITDIETALGRTLTATEQAQATQWIADALMLIEARLGDPALLDQTALDYVVREAVVSRFRNPEGYQSESIDDYTYRHPNETRRVTILPEWWELLAPLNQSGAFSTRPYFEPDEFAESTTL
jgi:myo-inositol catabolism protein IolC